ncbi:phospholipase A1-Igamma3, chloroplastic-like [Telopea speciosissima]|uniref:phospholipase A1-Igamma3, chloroplastic-like n=1 Tax=Telopea speciosissima TaxID=54955 RepID=UPI001CC71D98|nr:phospholipase A1-Igamma3, chloroplastic-like [Telopea speciosissima]
MDLNSLQSYNQTNPESPKEDTSSRWREIHGSSDWNNLLDPLHPWLRREIIKYGEFAQATYDAFDFDSLSEYCGSCMYNRRKIFDKLRLTKNGYIVNKYIYAMSHIDVPRWLEWTHLTDTWSKDSNWMGFVGFSNDDESHRIGRRDIVVAWRGTISACEWYKDLELDLIPIEDGDVKVEHGFHDIYTSKRESTSYNKSSASEQVMKQVTRLVSLYKTRGDQEVSLTITGHSLGGALALLNAYEAAKAIPDLPICVISFGGPKVGNNAFKEKLREMGVKTLRVVVKQDKVPLMPGIPGWQYTHVGTELKLDVQVSPYLKKGFDLIGFHSLETYLHLVDGFRSSTSEFRSDSRRDLALVNKYCGMLVDELKIPKCWSQSLNKGLVLNSYGKWVRPRRDPEDIPSTELRYLLRNDT